MLYGLAVLLLLAILCMGAGALFAGTVHHWYHRLWQEGQEFIQAVSTYSVIQRIALLLLSPIIVVTVVVMAVAPVALTLYLFSQGLRAENFWISLPCLFGLWLYSRRTDHLLKQTADWLKPLLIGMCSVGAIALIADLWIPRADWVWLFRIEEAARATNTTLQIVLPKSMWAKFALVFAILTAKLLFPTWGKWIQRVGKVPTIAVTLSSVLAVFVSMTLFGEGQSGLIGQSVAEEKYRRVEADTIAVAQLIISARLKENRETEAEASKQWLDAVFVGVEVDEKTPLDLENRALLFMSERERLRYFIQARVAELREAIANQHTVVAMRDAVDQTLASVLGRKLTEQDRSAASASFDKALGDFVSQAAKITNHPMIEFLNSVGAPELVQDLVKDLYKERVKELAKVVTEPLTDAIFRPGSPEAAKSLVTASQIVSRPAFAPETLPPTIARPTVEDRMRRAAEKRIARQAVEKAKAR